jgi:hypothetical protein
MKVGIYDTFFRPGDPSMTYYTVPPEGWGWVDNCDDPAVVDVVMATWGSYPKIMDSKHPRKIAYLQEVLTARPAPGKDILNKFDLILTHDKEILAQFPDKARYLTLGGTRIPADIVAGITPLDKFKRCSLVMSGQKWLKGHQLRHKVLAEHRRLPIDGLDIMGCGVDGRMTPPDVPFHAYMYNLAIENDGYNWWHTEKVWNGFATLTIPIYWGPTDLSKLTGYGFDVSPVIQWNSGDIPELRRIITEHGPEYWDNHLPAMYHNREVALKFYCHETLLKPVIKEFFAL